MADYIIATLADIELRTQTIEDDMSNSNVRHDIVGRNGAFIEPMGQEATVYKLRVFFLGEDDIAPYDNYPYFQELIEQNEIMEFRHPVFGIRQVAIDSMGTIYNNRIDTVEIVLELVEHVTDVQPVFVESIVPAAEKSFIETAQQAYDRISKNASEALGLESDGFLAKRIVEGETIGENIADLAKGAKKYAGVMDIAVSRMQSVLNTIANPANSLVGTIDWATDIPGTMLKAVAQTAERYAILNETVINSPETFVRNYEAGMLELEKTLGITSSDLTGRQTDEEIKADEARTATQEAVKSMGAQTSALNVSQAYDTDNERQSNVTAREAIDPIDIMGNYSKPGAIEYPMSVDDIEAALAAQQEYTQTVIDLVRDDVLALKDMLRALKRHVDQTKLARGLIITIAVDPPTPLHTILLQLGLSRDMYPRIVDLNRNTMPNPNFVSGDTRFYAS